MTRNTKDHWNILGNNTFDKAATVTTIIGIA